ncbi:MAG: hypothetical protein ACXABG_15495 [Promethearchaeota archaeon]|jgi:predicted transcriptional regulator
MTQTIIQTPFSLDNPNIKKVLEIAEEILQQKQVLTLDKLFSRAKRTLKIPNSGLKSIIQYLVNKKILVDQSRFTRISVMSNPVRKRLYYTIRKNIGVHLAAVKKLLQQNNPNLGVGQLLWHVDMLIKFDYIKSIKVGNYLILLPKELDDEYGRISFFLRDELNWRILKLLNSEGQLKRSEIYKVLNESRELIYYHVKNLIDYKLLLISDNSIIKIDPNISKTLNIILENEDNMSKKKLLDYEVKK